MRVAICVCAVGLAVGLAIGLAARADQAAHELGVLDGREQMRVELEADVNQASIMCAHAEARCEELCDNPCVTRCYEEQHP